MGGNRPGCSLGVRICRDFAEPLSQPGCLCILFRAFLPERVRFSTLGPHGQAGTGLPFPTFRSASSNITLANFSLTLDTPPSAQAVPR